MAEIAEFRNIAIIQTAFLGDVALSLPFIENIRNNAPLSEITLLTTPAASSLGFIANAVDYVISYDKRGIHRGIRGIKLAAEQLKKRNTDCIIGLHRSLRSSLITFFAKPEFSVGYSNAAFSLVYKKRATYRKHLHEIDRNIELFTGFDGTSISVRQLAEVELRNLDEESEYVYTLLKKYKLSDEDKLIAIAPGSVWATKRWKKEYFIALSSMMKDSGYHPIMIGSAQDKGLCREIAEKSNSVSLAGEATIPQTIAFLRIAQAIVTNDSAPTHFAGLAGCPCVAIFGPTSPIFGFAPRGINDVVLQDDKLKCKPCRIHGSKECPVGTHECMLNITPEMVFNAIGNIC